MELDNYSNEGRNYPTVGSTGNSPINTSGNSTISSGGGMFDGLSGLFSNGMLGQFGMGMLGNAGAEQSAESALNGWKDNFGTLNEDYWKRVQGLDTFAPMRQNSLEQLLGIQNNPNQYLQSERFQAPLQQSMEAMRRNQAQQGMLGSGNSMAELQQLGQTTGLKALTDRENQLARWAGSDFSLNQALQGDAGMRNQQMSGMSNFLMNRAGTQANSAGASGSGGGMSSIGGLLGTMSGIPGGGAIGSIIGSFL